MACGECASGKFGCGCCCASVTNIKGGIHPDSMQVACRDLVLDQTIGAETQTHRSIIVLYEPVHIVSVNASLIAVRRDELAGNQDKQLQEPSSGAVGNVVRATTASVSLFTLPGYSLDSLEEGGFNPNDAQDQNRDFFCTASLSSSMPTYESHPDLFGYFADGGLFAELNAPSADYGIRLIVRYVPRLQFPPAYHDPLDVMQHYWKCSRGDKEFLEDFYGGTTLDFPSDSTRDGGNQNSGGFSWYDSSLGTQSSWGPL